MQEQARHVSESVANFGFRPPHPSAYYVNVHSSPAFPAGAVRGQLSK
jgi:hypothetical protein